MKGIVHVFILIGFLVGSSKLFGNVVFASPGIEVIRCFNDCEKQVENFDEGALLFQSLTDHLSICYLNSSQLQQAYLYALDAIGKEKIPFGVKEKLKAVVNKLAHQCLLVGEIQPTIDFEDNISGSLVLGGVEILVGALVHLIPGCGWLGKLIIADGIRRGFNGLEDMENTNKDRRRESHVKGMDVEHIRRETGLYVSQ